MAIKHVRVKNTKTGAIASLPTSALPNMPDWVAADGPAPARPKSKKTLPPAKPPADSASVTENEE